eukprot:gene18138-biopygen5258
MYTISVREKVLWEVVWHRDFKGPQHQRNVVLFHEVLLKFYHIEKILEFLVLELVREDEEVHFRAWFDEFGAEGQIEKHVGESLMCRVPTCGYMYSCKVQNIEMLK